MNAKECIFFDLQNLGIKKGDALFVHSSFKSLGEIEGGAQAFFDALISYLGEEGTLVFPAFTFGEVTLENPVCSMKNSKSAVGYLSEYFRTQVSGVKRSRHATHSCCAWGKYRDFLVQDHQKDNCAVGKNSPIYKLQELGGKILFLGCSTDRNTAMHGVERIYGSVPFSSPYESVYTIITEEGDKINQTLSRGAFVVNGVEYAQKYSRMENLLNKEEMQRGKILAANCVVMSSKAVWEKGLQKMREDVFYFVEPIK